MSPNAAPHAVSQGSHNATEVALAMDPGVKCFPQNVLSAVKTPRCPLNRTATGRCTAAIAIAKLLALALTTEAADTVVGEIANLAEEEIEDIKLAVPSFPLVWQHQDLLLILDCITE